MTLTKTKKGLDRPRSWACEKYTIKTLFLQTMHSRAAGGTEVANWPELFMFPDPDLPQSMTETRKCRDKALIGTAISSVHGRERKSMFSVTNNYVVSILIRNKPPWPQVDLCCSSEKHPLMQDGESLVSIRPSLRELRRKLRGSVQWWKVLTRAEALARLPIWSSVGKIFR